MVSPAGPVMPSVPLRKLSIAGPPIESATKAPPWIVKFDDSVAAPSTVSPFPAAIELPKRALIAESAPMFRSPAS
jgi:hypothetical protein